ncbi:hypothetical protein [Brevibacillus reuszeri]|uniref:hypothetical protein n=1 Tax=Brevibacillus reuszeri TaxID=54915 RepID=UPI000CCBD726|nr:hypothetical protein [Brevibacillus reuszeri]
MKRTLYILAAITILAGCSAKEPDAPTAPVTAPATEPSAATTLTEEDKAEIAAKYGLEKPDQPAGNVSVQVGISTSADQPTKSGVKAIAGKTESDVSTLLGKPTATEDGEWTVVSTDEKMPYLRHTYKTDIGEISVMFLEGVAARIEVTPAETFKYPEDAAKAMRVVGLAVEDGLTPDNEAPHYMQYNNVDGFYYVNVVKDLEGNPENISYVRVITDRLFK